MSTVNVAVLYLGDDVLSIYVADTEDEVNLKVRDWLETTYTSASMYDLDETLDVFLHDHSMHLETVLVNTELKADDVKYAGVISYPGTQAAFVGAEEDDVWNEAIDFLKVHWHNYDEELSEIRNMSALEERFGEDVFTYQHVAQ